MNQYDPAELKPHPLTKSLPRWDAQDPRFLNLCDDVRDHGIRQPLLITADHKIVDGVLRWLAAKKRQLTTVPCLVVPDGLVATTAIQTLVQRKHHTKSALAYLTFPLMADALEEARQQQANSLKQGARSPLSGLRDIKTADELADLIGIGRTLFFYAKELHEIFAERDDLKKQFEPSILEEDKGLGAIIAGVNYLLKGARRGGGEKGTVRQLELFAEGLETIKVRMTLWQKFDLPQREEAVKVIRSTVAAMPDDLVMEWERAIKLHKREKGAA